MNSLASRLLVASRDLRDPNFVATVVLMVEHSGEGALGLVLNRLTNKTVADVWHSLGHGDCTFAQPVHSGGPVPGPLIALHDCEKLGEKRVLPGVFMSVQKDLLEELVRREQPSLRLFTGHSGWSGGQLEGELSAGGWVMGDAQADDVFQGGELGPWLWRRVLSRISVQIAAPQLAKRRVPDDPSVN